MKKVALLIAFIATTATAQHAFPTMGKIVNYAESFSLMVAANAPVEVIATNLKWSEGPVWVKGKGKEEGYLLFSDAPQNTIFKWDEKNGVSTFLSPAGYTGLGRYSDEPGSNGLIINRTGELVACEHGDRRISKMDLKTGGKVTLADGFKGKRFNSPNDICQHSNGTYFFTDPPYGLPNRETDTANREIAQNGVYSLGADGKVKQIVADLKRPNGVALSPDEKLLYVAQSDGSAPYIMAYPVKKDGTVGSGTIFFDFTKYKKELGATAADGLKVDAKGNVYAAAANGVVVITPMGRMLGRIETGVPTSNCAFGADGYLYITAQHYVCRVKML